LRNGNSIKDTTQEVVVGQKIELSVAVTGGTPTNQQWTIAGDRVKSYFAFTTLGKVTSLDELNQQNISFHWFKGGDDKQVTFTATINGQQYTATANFNVKQPSVTNFNLSKGNIFVNYSAGNPTLTYGDPTFSPGVRFEAQVDNNGISGSYHWVQTYVESKSLRLSSPLGNCNAGQTMTRNQQGLDETYPYPSPTSSGLILEDSPRMSLISTNDRVTINDSASAWLMFRPNLTDAIWVPIKKVNWSWEAEAMRVNNNNEWQKVSSSNPNPLEDSNLFFPEWDTVINNALQFTCQQ
jgi:outer membrane biogenesis lipoprotein LolB